MKSVETLLPGRTQPNQRTRTRIRIDRKSHEISVGRTSFLTPDARILLRSSRPKCVGSARRIKLTDHKINQFFYFVCDFEFENSENLTKSTNICHCIKFSIIYDAEYFSWTILMRVSSKRILLEMGQTKETHASRCARLHLYTHPYATENETSKRATTDNRHRHHKNSKTNNNSIAIGKSLFKWLNIQSR